MNQMPHDPPTQRVALIKARWHAEIVDRAHEGFVRELEALGRGEVGVEVFEVPGAYEIPLLALELAGTNRYSAIVACAFVVDGGIYRHEFVAQAVVSGLMQAQLEARLPMLSVVLTPQRYSDTTDEDRRFFIEHFEIKGAEAARAYVSLRETLDPLVDAHPEIH